MKGLLIKDFLLLRSYGKSLLLMFLLFLIIGATSGPAFIVGIVMIESVMLAVSTFIPCKLYYSGSPFYPGYPYGILGVSSDLEHQFCYFPVFVSPWKMDLWF